MSTDELRLDEYRALRAKRARLLRDMEYEVRAEAGLSTVMHQLQNDCEILEGRLGMLRNRGLLHERAVAAYIAEEDVVTAPLLSPLTFDLAFTDVETSGTDEKRHEILELAIVRTDPITLLEKTRFHRYFMPVNPVPAEAAKINGFDEDLWRSRGAKVIHPADLEEISDVLRDAAFTGQVIGFDMRFLLAAYDMLGQAYPDTDYHVIDIATYSWPLVVAGKVRGMSLKHSRKFFGLEGEQKHTALADVLDEIEVYKHFMRAYVKAWEGVEALPILQGHPS